MNYATALFIPNVELFFYELMIADVMDSIHNIGWVEAPRCDKARFWPAIFIPDATL